MKRWVPLVLVLALLWALGASPARGESYTAPGLFTVSYDGGVYSLDTEAYAQVNAGADNPSRWLFILYNDTFMFDASTIQIDGYEGLSLDTADEAARLAYQEDFLDEFGDDAELVEASPQGSRGIPMYIFRCRDESGPYLVAETVLKGTVIQFLAYYNDAALPVNDGLLGALKTLLATFEPV